MDTRRSSATPGEVESGRGVLVVDAAGSTLAASGILRDAGLAAQVLAGWREAKRHERKLFTVGGAGAGGLVVVALPAPESTVLVALRREARDVLFEMVASTEFAGDVLAHFLKNPFEAVTVVDTQGILRYMSPVHERFFGLEAGAAVGRHITEVIENTGLHRVASSGKSEIGLLHEMRGETRVVTRHAIHNERGQTVGALGQIMFKGPEQLQALSAELNKLKSEVAYYRRELTGLRNRSYGLDQMVGTSAAMQRLKQQIVKVAPLDVPVLLTGESGTGKELAAHAIHKLSARRDADLVMVNAAALPATLVESELFGYEAGAFTGAERKGRKGKIEQADRGTLFFDEVGDMPGEMQVKLLRVLQDGSFQRVGGNELRRSNFRLISASNRDFESMIADGSFRLDLFYRIGGVTVRLPALRERVEDIPELAELALAQFAERHGHRAKRLSLEAAEFLKAQRWPGNVRQLMHAVERAAIFADAEAITAADFGFVDLHAAAPAPPARSAAPALAFAQPAAAVPSGASRAAAEPMRVASAVDQVKEQMIRQAMAQFHGNKKRVAAELGISRSYLYKRLAQMGLGAVEPHEA
jgi:transcriptional regulator with PAS, ATPase and Fis domain